MQWRLTIYAFLFFCSVGQAYLLGDLPQNSLPPQSCEMRLYTAPNASGQYSVFTCSGTVVSGRQFLTAAHCGYGEAIVRGEIRCPGAAPIPVTNISRHPWYKNNDDKKIDCKTVPYDVAVITVQDEFPISPVRLPRNRAEIDTLVGDPNSCRVYGYGLDRNRETGNHNGAHAHIEDWLTGTRTWTQDGVVVRTEPIKSRFYCDGLVHFKGRIVQSGDSGGTLLCDTPAGVPVVVGVTRGDVPGKDDNVSATLRPTLDWVKQQLPSQPATVASTSPSRLRPHAHTLLSRFLSHE